MADKLVRIYALVQDAAGLAGKTKLAMETKIPSTKAALLPDSPENLELFREAYRKVVGKDLPRL